jgi:hypothetical protein
MKRVLFLLTLVFLAGARIWAADDARTKPLLEEALRVYGDRQYVRALDLFKQVQRIDPENATAKEYVQSCEQRILEWNKQDVGDGKAADPTWDSLLKNKKGTDPQNNANEIVAARRSLVERMKKRSTNTDNIVQIQETRKGVEITLYHDQLFLPGLQTLRDEALPVLENVAQVLRDKGDRAITIQSVAHEDSNDPFLLYPDVASSGGADPSLPQMKSGTSMLFQDIESTRAFILFTYLAQRSMKPAVSIAKE